MISLRQRTVHRLCLTPTSTPLLLPSHLMSLLDLQNPLVRFWSPHSLLDMVVVSIGKSIACIHCCAAELTKPHCVVHYHPPIVIEHKCLVDFCGAMGAEEILL